MGNCLNVSRTTVRQPEVSLPSVREVQHAPLSPSHPVYSDYVTPSQRYLSNIDNIIGRMRALSHSSRGQPPFNSVEFMSIRRALGQLRNDSRGVRTQSRQINAHFISGERFPGEAHQPIPLRVLHDLERFHRQFVLLGRRYNNEIISVSGGTEQPLPDVSSSRQDLYRQDSDISEFGIPLAYLAEEGR